MAYVADDAFDVVTAEQVDELAEYAHVYMTKDGRISMAGLNEGNIQVGSCHRRNCWS
jgi:aspartate/tyrosine/aromatic aminotransferase